MKTITLNNGKKYLKKNLCEIGITQRGCVFKKHKEMSAYDYGMVVIRMEDGVYKCFATDNIEYAFNMMFYDTDGPEDELLFVDESIERGWNAVFVYMFDEHGAFLLYATRGARQVTGARARYGDEILYPSIRREAIVVASLFQVRLVDRLLSMERETEERSSETTLLSVGIEDGKRQF